MFVAGLSVRFAALCKPVVSERQPRELFSEGLGGSAGPPLPWSWELGVGRWSLGEAWIPRSGVQWMMGKGAD